MNVRDTRYAVEVESEALPEQVLNEQELTRVF